MTSKTVILAAAVGSLIALSGTAFSADDSSEKCYGVAKAAKNDCAGGAHACAGQSSKDGSQKEFVQLPKGTCERVVGGSLAPGK